MKSEHSARASETSSVEAVANPEAKDDMATQNSEGTKNAEPVDAAEGQDNRNLDDGQDGREQESGLTLRMASPTGFLPEIEIFSADLGQQVAQFVGGKLGGYCKALRDAAEAAIAAKQMECVSLQTTVQDLEKQLCDKDRRIERIEKRRAEKEAELATLRAALDQMAADIERQERNDEHLAEKLVATPQVSVSPAIREPNKEIPDEPASDIALTGVTESSEDKDLQGHAESVGRRPKGGDASHSEAFSANVLVDIQEFTHGVGEQVTTFVRHKIGHEYAALQKTTQFAIEAEQTKCSSLHVTIKNLTDEQDEKDRRILELEMGCAEQDAEIAMLRREVERLNVGFEWQQAS